jgi:hypothetical protein
VGFPNRKEAYGLEVWFKVSRIEICDPEKNVVKASFTSSHGRRQLFLQKYGNDSRVKNRMLGFRLMIRSLENALKSGIYSLLWAWVSVA